MAQNHIYQLVFVITLFAYCFGNEVYAATQVSGVVRDMNSTPIPYVAVFLKNEKQNGVSTDSQGYFNLYGDKGQHTLVFSHASFKYHEVAINLSDQSSTNNLFYNVYLEEKNINLKETVISESIAMTTLSLSGIKDLHKEIAGGTSVAIMQPEVQRLETIKDALKFESGVVIQEFFGANDQPRISIRGSGIQSNPQRRGIYLLQDGIPVNLADGTFIIGIMDPSISESIEVYKGANSLHFGSASLGGAINFNTHTGRRTEGLRVKIGGGSFGYASASVLVGKNWGKTDAFLSVSGSRQNGFREHNENRKLNISGNLGYRFSKKVDNRTYINYSYSDFEIPGPLTMNMLKDDPTQINHGISLPHYMGPNIARDLPGRTTAITRIANRTNFMLSPRLNMTLSVYYQHVKDRFAFPIVLSTQRSTDHDYGLSLHTVYKTPKGKLIGGLLSSQGLIDRRGHINKNGKDSYMFMKDQLNAVNVTLYTEYSHDINENLKVIANVNAMYNTRNSKDVFPDPTLRPWYSHTSHKYRYFHSSNISMNQSFWSVNPRIGAIYNVGKNKNYQFFGNVSTSYEPPTFDELVGTAVSNNINTSPKELFAIKLEKQTAITTELGTRHEGNSVHWNLSIYRSWLKNELLEVKDFVLGVKETQNYPHTIHQGVELSFAYIPFKGVFSKHKKDQIILKGMYNLSDFYFSSGEYKGKTLAGVPKHYLTAAIEYNYPGRFFLALNAESQLSKNPIDHTNTVFQPAYHIYGFRLGVDGIKGFSFYIEGKNIFNQHYASSYIINDQIIPPPIPFPNFNVNNITFFMPGQLRAFYVGLSYKLDKKNQL